MTDVVLRIHHWQALRREEKRRGKRREDERQRERESKGGQSKGGERNCTLTMELKALVIGGRVRTGGGGRGLFEYLFGSVFSFSALSLHLFSCFLIS
jgi:hypothetical protein